MSSKIKSEGTQEKFNKKVVKFLLSLNGVNTENPNYPDQYIIETVAGPLKVTVFPPKESALFSIYTKFVDVDKANEVNNANRLPNGVNFNQTTGKWNFIHSSEKTTIEHFTNSIKKIYAPGIDVTFTVKLKGGDELPEFLEGLGKGVIKKQTVTYKVTEEEFKEPMLQMNIQEFARQLLHEHFEVVIEQGDTTKNIKIKKNG